jgi:hypothetical protein
MLSAGAPPSDAAHRSPPPASPSASDFAPRSRGKSAFLPDKGTFRCCGGGRGACTARTCAQADGARRIPGGTSRRWDMGDAHNRLGHAFWVSAAILLSISDFGGCGGVVTSKQSEPTESPSAEGASGTQEAGSGAAMEMVDNHPGAAEDASGAQEYPPEVQCDSGAPDVVHSACAINASDYDRSCASDRDCVLVQEGNACSTDCSFLCSQAAISARASCAYRDAIARAPSHSMATCACPAMRPPCCRAGSCQTRCG